MRAKMKQINPKERENCPIQPASTRLRVKRTRNVLIDPEAKKTPTKRMRSIANTKRRSGTSLTVAAEVGRRAGGRRAEKRVINIKVMRKEAARRAKTNIHRRKRRRKSPKLIRRRKVRVMTLIKNRKTTPKEETAKVREQNQKARKELQKIADRAAEAKIKEDLERRKTKTRSGTKTGSEAATAGVGTEAERTRREHRPGIKSTGPEARTEVRPETPTEADAPGARAAGESAAESARLTGGTKTGGAAAAPAAPAPPTATGRRGRAAGARTPNGEAGALQDQKTGGTGPDRGPTAPKAKIKTTAGGIGPAPAPAPTATEPTSSPTVPERQRKPG